MSTEVVFQLGQDLGALLEDLNKRYEKGSNSEKNVKVPSQ